jgi:UDP-2,4-diacetamido-2,4,6-trideoxy-beta-L-altropyranose hydrolase
MKLALFRADGSRHLGVGHIMRCLALAQSLGKRGVGSVFVIRDYDQRITEIIRCHGYDVETIPHGSGFAEDASLTSRFAIRYKVNLIVTDLCHQDSLANLEEYSRYFQSLRAAHKFTITIDDLIKADSPSDIKIIPYYGAEKMDYQSDGSTKLLLGPAYFIFRREFIEAAKVSREIRKDARNILVTMGGSDLLNLTIKIAKAFKGLNKTSLSLRIVVGPGFATLVRQELASILDGYSGDFELIMGSDNMADLMLWADLAIIAGGLTKYETAVTGTPSIIISQTAYEADKAKIFEKGGSALHLGHISEISEADIAKAIEKSLEDDILRTQMAKRGRNMVDGKGVERVISEIPQEVLS